MNPYRLSSGAVGATESPCPHPAATTPVDVHAAAITRLELAARRLQERARWLDPALQRRHLDLAAHFRWQARCMLGSQLGQGGWPPQPAMQDGPNTQRPVTAASAAQGAQGLRGLDDLAGAEPLKSLLRARFIHPLRHPQQAALYRQQARGGLLLYGPPGTGKTMAAKALAAELAVPVFTISPAEVLSKWHGESEKQLAALFAQAGQFPAAIVFIDEIDTLAARRDADSGGSPEAGGAMQRLLTQLLTLLDGYQEQRGQLLFIGATNRPWAIDDALLRPGRFDALAFVGLPGLATRELLLRRQLDGVPAEATLPWREAALALQGCTAAEVRACAQHAARLAFEDALRGGHCPPVHATHLRVATEQACRATTAAMLARFEQFAQARGLPTPPADDEGSQALPGGVPGDTTGAANATAPDAPALDPLHAVQARDLQMEHDALPFICYALQHAGMAPVQNLTLHNTGAEPSQNLLVEVALAPADYCEPWQTNLAELPAGTRWQSGPIRLPLRLDRLRSVTEKEGAHLRITVRDKEEVLLARTLELPVLAYNEWVYLPRFLQLSAAFVQPNSPALHPVVQAASAHLQASTGSTAFPGYQARSAEHVAHMLRAMHRALAEDCGLAYINPPPSFELSGQKVRLVADTLAQGRGTCLDLAILQAALWEHVGLHPCLLLIPGHAMLGCWMQEQAQRAAVVAFGKPGQRNKGQATPRVAAHQRQVLQALESGRLRLFNSVEVALGQSLDAAEQAARRLFEGHLKADEEMQLIDVAACRGEVTPLP